MSERSPEPAPQRIVEQKAERPGSGPAIRVRHLWHQYGAHPVVQDVSFDVKRGEIFGFVGPNGAGKTTTIRIIATLLEPMAGRVEVGGLDVALEPDRVRRLIGYMADHVGVYERVSVYEYLDFFARAAGVMDPSAVETVLELVELNNLRERLVAALSKGMRQRLQVARILLHDPEVLVLDEPASDLDPRARIELRDLLLELRDLGKTILLSSHILSELSDICTSVGIIEHGRLLVHGPVDELGSRLQGGLPAPSADWAPASPPTPHDPNGIQAAAGIAARPGSHAPVDPPRTPGGVPSPARARRRLRLRVLGDGAAVVQLLAGGQGVLGVQPDRGGTLLVEHLGDDRFVAQVVAYLVSRGVAVVGVESERNELERIFLEATQGDLR